MTAPVAFYENDYFRHDLRQGSVHNRYGTKFCFLPPELLLGLQRTLEDETGPAWREVLKRVGRIWGSRVAARFNDEFTQHYGRPLHELPMAEFASLVEAHFRYHGWGEMTLDFSLAEHGLIVATLRESAFVEIIGANEWPIDAIVSGVLAELVAQVSERDDLECIETECAAQGAPACRFIVGLRERLARVPGYMEQGARHDEIINRLALSQAVPA
jgi:predicted hydrocarbon binding protein